MIVKEGEKACHDLAKLSVIEDDILLISYNHKFEKILEKFI